MNRSSIRSRFLNLSAFSLLAVLLLSACAPTISTPVISAPVNPGIEPASSAVPATAAPAGTETTGTAPVVTPRGPDLVATDPSTVSLASGGLQLVEFFRFT